MCPIFLWNAEFLPGSILDSFFFAAPYDKGHYLQQSMYFKKACRKEKWMYCKHSGEINVLFLFLTVTKLKSLDYAINKWWIGLSEKPCYSIQVHFCMSVHRCCAVLEVVRTFGQRYNILGTCELMKMFMASFSIYWELSCSLSFELFLLVMLSWSVFCCSWYMFKSIPTAHVCRCLSCRLVLSFFLLYSLQL